MAEFAEIEPDLAEWDYGDYESLRSVDIHRGRPGWNVFRDGCPNGESAAQICARADRLIIRLHTMEGNIALFSHGHFGAALAARWIGLPMIEAKHFRLGTASLSILGSDPHHPDVPVIELWNSPPYSAFHPPPVAIVLERSVIEQQSIQRWENEGGREFNGSANERSNNQ